MSYTIFLILIVIVALLLILIIMVQNPKGGGLDGSFGGSSQLGGVQSTNKFLDTTTWGLAAFLAVLILTSNFAIPRDRVNSDTNLKETISDVEVRKDTPKAPTTETQTTDKTTSEAPASDDESK